MYLENLKSDFYEFITGKRICLIVHFDIDSICTCKILQSLLRYKQISYTLSVVQGVNDLKNVYRENAEQVKYYVLINCGGTIDLVDVLEPEEDVVIFVLDSHRPTDLCNIYSNGQIRLLWTAEDDLDVPEFQEIFCEDESDDEESSEDESEGRVAKRRRLGEEAIMKRRERRLWEAKREKIVFEYSQFTYYAKASALMMFDLAWKLNRDDKDLLWYTIIALTEQMIYEKIENTQYVLETGNLQAHATRLLNRTSDTDNTTSLKITFENDLKLVLYRHWSIEASLKYSTYTACKLRLWSLKGDKRLHELLADMGFPLVQSRQNYLSMDLQLRQEFPSAIAKLSEKYGLTDIEYTTFTMSYGYRNKYCAADVVYGMMTILECSPKTKKCEECFQTALDCLSRSHKNLLNAAIEKAKGITVSLFKTVQAALDMKRIISAGPFIYYIVQEGGLDWYLFTHQHILSLLAQFIIRAYVVMTRNRNASSLPLIISAPKDIEKGTCIVMGIPPLCENSPKNFFGKAFEQAAQRTNSDAVCDYFDTAYFDIPVKDRTRFLDALTALLS
ncbi:hypothetical protein RN001_010795 [Aquatica leii]|uniref:Cell division cycle 45 n=1 Tax=Aquatica leii TaxID=1421715 RepID=A0AAN7P718_9COLE|nr:hypothetical protein RN001_010795 [Aquatica leii]